MKFEKEPKNNQTFCFHSYFWTLFCYVSFDVMFKSFVVKCDIMNKLGCKGSLHIFVMMNSIHNIVSFMNTGMSCHSTGMTGSLTVMGKRSATSSTIMMAAPLTRTFSLLSLMSGLPLTHSL